MKGLFAYYLILLHLLKFVLLFLAGLMSMPSDSSQPARTACSYQHSPGTGSSNAHHHQHNHGQTSHHAHHPHLSPHRHQVHSQHGQHQQHPSLSHQSHGVQTCSTTGETINGSLTVYFFIFLFFIQFQSKILLIIYKTLTFLTWVLSDSEFIGKINKKQ